MKSMTNEDHLLLDAKALMNILLHGSMWCVNDHDEVKCCSQTDCHKCKFHSDKPCSESREEWLTKEYEEPLLFPIGTIVEVTLPSNDCDLQYYNGMHDNRHFCTHFHSYIGKTDISGKPSGLIYNKDNIRKVGD